MVALQEPKNQPSLLEYAPSDAEPGYLSSFEEQAVIEAMECGSQLSKQIREEIAFIYEVMVVRKGDRKLKKSDLSFNKLAEMLDWGFSPSQWYRIGQAALIRKDISARVEQENWDVGNVDDVADSVLLDLDRVEPEFKQEALELAREHGNGNVTNKALEKAVDEISGRYDNPEMVAKPKLKKTRSTGEPQEKVSAEDVAKLQDMLVKERSRRQELEQEVSLLKSSPQSTASIDPAIIEELVADRLSQKAQQVAQLEQQLQDEIAKREKSQQAADEAAQRLQLLEQVTVENEKLKQLVQTLESQLKKVAVDAPEVEVVTNPVATSEPNEFWRRKENLAPVTQEQMAKAFDKDCCVRCDNRSVAEQFELSLGRQGHLEKDLAVTLKSQKRHNPGSPSWNIYVPNIEEIQNQITFEQELRASLGYVPPAVVEEPVACITKEDADKLLAFVDENKVSRQRLKEIALISRGYERLGQLNVKELQEVWEEVKKAANEPIPGEYLEYIYTFMEENDISSEVIYELVLAPRKLECLEDLRLCDVREAIATINELLEF
jgi:hypothetical protein